jgi:hypothetical protein
MTLFRGGKLPAQPARPQLRLSAVLAALPAPPVSCDWQSDSITWPMYANDTWGCCTCAAAGHIVNQFTFYGSGQEVQPSDADVLGMYSRVTGFDPQRPSTDQGAYCQDVLGDWRKNGLAGHKIAAYASVDVGNLVEVKQAIATFGNVYVGLNVPQSAMDAFDAGRVWDVVKRSPSLGGHCVPIGTYDSTQKLLGGVTWGSEFQMTEAFWKANVDEAWVVLDGDGLTRAGGYFAGAASFYDLGVRFQQLTGEPNPIPQPVDPTPVPSPPPSPTPAPVPVPDPRLVQARALMDEWAHDNGVS